MRMVHHDANLRLAAKLLASGGRMVSRTRLEANFAGGCSAPREVTRYSRPEAARGRMEPVEGAWKLHGAERFVRVAPGTAAPLEIVLMVPCRACVHCGRRRAGLWKIRAYAEARVSLELGARTWFGTLTCSPEFLYRSKCQTEVWMAARGVNFDAELARAQFRELDRVIYREVQMFLKRLRALGHEFRYLCVTEAHRSGEPHYHMLLHEQSPHKALPKSLLEAHWEQQGFSAWRLLHDLRAAAYCCKYLTKSSSTVVRASFNYGGPPYRVAPEGLQAAAVERSEERVPDDQRSESIAERDLDPTPAPSPPLAEGAGGCELERSESVNGAGRSELGGSQD